MHREKRLPETGGEVERALQAPEWTFPHRLHPSGRICAPLAEVPGAVVGVALGLGPAGGTVLGAPW